MQTKFVPQVRTGFFWAFLALLAICLMDGKLASAAPATPEGAFVGVCSAIVYDMDHDAILFEQNPDQPIPPASLTKIMSMFLARDFVRQGHAKMDSIVPVSAAAASTGGSRMGLKAGEELPLRKLLMGMAVSSGNDASHAVAEYVGGSVGAFVKMMNLKAAKLGMNDSHFYNPHGLPAEGQRTTARDMLALARAYLKAYPDALDFHNTRTLTHRGYTSWNKNPLLGQYPGADGLKSGWIRASGHNLVFTATRGKRRLLAVILGAPDSSTRGVEACRLLDAGFMVCGNAAVSVAAALDTLPYDEDRIDPRKTARDAGLLRSRANSRAFADNSRPAREQAAKASSGKAARKQTAKVLAANSKSARTQAKNAPGVKRDKHGAQKAARLAAAKNGKPASAARVANDAKGKKSQQASRKVQKGKERKS